MIKFRILPLTTLAIAGLLLTGMNVSAADKAREAIVAGGQTVKLANSRFSTNELKARRPDMVRLIPKKR